MGGHKWESSADRMKKQPTHNLQMDVKSKVRRLSEAEAELADVQGRVNHLEAETAGVMKELKGRGVDTDALMAAIVTQLDGR